MHMIDIQHDLAAGDIKGIEDAFRALVGWPREDRIAGATNSQLRALLPRLCKALAADSNLMPRETRAAIEDVGDARTDGTYAAGAKVVEANLTRWLQHISVAGAA